VHSEHYTTTNNTLDIFSFACDGQCGTSTSPFDCSKLSLVDSREVPHSYISFLRVSRHVLSCALAFASSRPVASASFVASAQKLAACPLPIHRQSTITAPTHRMMSSGSNDEVTKAQAAGAGAADTGAPTVYDKILSGEWPSDKVYEDDTVLAFRDINPQAPVHILVIPKHRDGLTALSKARTDQKEILGHLMYVASEVGKKECPNGFRIIVNDGVDGAQSVMHLHLHIMGGRQMGWPPG
jgi:histidine triad (HIT) family protein